MSCNFMNVPLSIATRHQYDIAHRLLGGCESELRDVKFTSGDVAVLADMMFADEINLCMGNVGKHFKLYNCKAAEVTGTKYTCGDYLIAGTENDMPVFVHIKHIFIHSQGEQIWFVCHKLTIEYFEPHLHAWKVHQVWPANFVSVDPRQLQHSIPLLIHHLVTCIYVAGLRFRI